MWSRRTKIFLRLSNRACAWLADYRRLIVYLALPCSSIGTTQNDEGQ